MNSNSGLKTYLKHFLERFEPALKEYLEEKIANLDTLDPSGQEIARVVGTFASGGGKRIRAALVEIGYRAGGGENDDRILKPAIAMELLHAFFLIHDDIMDRSDLRRNQPTVHRVFESNYRELMKNSDDRNREHFAESMALLAGDLCCAMAYEAITKSDFPSTRLLLALKKMHAVVDTTVVGQVLDILTPLKGTVCEEEITKIHRLKTACYTFEGPLQFGMILAGACAEKLETISQYAIPVGIAFQIKDDLLGVFGSEKEVGKPVTSDLEEGKETLLTVFARAHGNQAQRNRIASLIGKHPISIDELNDVRGILREVGAVSYCETRMHELVQAGKKALDGLPEDTANILEELADLSIGRTT